MIAVTFALPAESSDFVSSLREVTRARRDGIEAISGTLRETSIIVMHTGVGEKSVRLRLGKFLSQHTPAALISAGFAGALNDDLQMSEVLLAENFSSAALLERARGNLTAATLRTATLVTAAGIIDSPERRRDFGRESGAAAVDMETEFIAELCARSAIPMLSLRAITDTPSTPFPAPPGVLFDLEEQKTKFLPLFAYLVVRPLALPRFIAFAKNVALSRARLTSALDRLLSSDLS